jgi:hypothetical protein
LSATLETASQFLSALKRGDGGALGALLAEDAGYQQLNVAPLAGRAAIVARMTAADTGKIYRDAAWGEPASRWSKPVSTGDNVLLQGALPKDAPLGSVALTLFFRDGRVALVQHQTLPGALPPPAPLKLPEDLKRKINKALSEWHTMMIVYNDLEDQPTMTLRGSTLVFSDTQLAMWIRNREGGFIRSIARRPKVLMYYRDDSKRATYHFRGRAHLDDSEATRKYVYETMEQVERDHDFAGTGVPVVIDLDWVEGWAGVGPAGLVDPVRMARGA